MQVATTAIVFPGGSEGSKECNVYSTGIFVGEAMMWEFVMSFRLQDYKVNPVSNFC